MGALGRIVEACARAWRVLTWTSEYSATKDLLLADSLALSLPEPMDENATEEAREEVRAGRIPERSLPALAAAKKNRGGWVTAAWFAALPLALGVALSPFDKTASPGSVVFRGLMSTVLVGVAVALTRRWWRLARDVRERRIRVEEGELTRKWKQVYLGGDEKLRERFVAHIGGRPYLLRSRALFDVLGAGVRYRMHVSERAGLFVAIETVERRAPAGYRGAPAGAPRSAAVDEPGDRARRSRP